MNPRPLRATPRWRWVTPGSVFTVVIWMLGSSCYSWYFAHVAHYGRTYGSLGVLVGLMTWIWLSVTVVLVGAELDAEMESRAEGRTGAEIRARSVGMGADGVHVIRAAGEVE